MTTAETVQFHHGGFLDGVPAEPQFVHVEIEKSGRTLCGIEMFDPAGPGWSRGGGFSNVDAACPSCMEEYDGKVVLTGLNANAFRETPG